MTFKQELFLESVRMHKFLLQDPLMSHDEDAVTQNVRVIEETFKKLLDAADKHSVTDIA